jgi:RHS repeat-associated protein
VVEEQVNGAMTAQYVWSPVYVDAMIERDTAGGPRLYVQQDAHWNVTALVDTTGTPKERYTYDPYGKATVLNPTTWQVSGSGAHGTSSYGWVYLHQGGRYERYSDAAGMYLFRNRDYSPTLGRWLEQDPAGYAGSGPNLYQALGSAPTVYVDPSGLWCSLNAQALDRMGRGLLAFGAGLFLLNVPNVSTLGVVGACIFWLYAAEQFATGLTDLLFGTTSQSYTAQIFEENSDVLRNVNWRRAL